MKSKDEANLQSGCVRWFRYAYPKFQQSWTEIHNVKGKTKITHITISLLQSSANGGSRHMLEAKNLSSQGLCPGVPDLFLAVPRQGYHGLYMELKRLADKNIRKKAGVCSREQKTMMNMLAEQGYLCVVIYSQDEFIHTVNCYLCTEQRALLNKPFNL
jgi:hypothetical protein